MLTDLLLVPFGATWAQVRDAGLAAEAAGFDGLWTWDHLSGAVHGADAVLESWTTLAALAARVPRVAIGPLVLNVANRHPGVLAAMAGTLQEVAEGRLLLGLGAGGGAGTPYVAEQRMLGRAVPGDAERRERVAEAATVLRRLWAGDLAPHDGPTVALRGAVGYARPGAPPPIVVGAFGPKMAALAGAVGDGINCQAGAPRLRELLTVARDAHRAAGRDPAAFLTTVFAGLSDRWLRRGSPDRGRLEALGVDRLILLVEPPFPPAEITAAGRQL